MKPIHKFNGGLGATLCHKCSVIISIGLTEDLYCERCKCKDCNTSLEDCTCIEDTLDMKETTKCYCGHTTYCDCGPEEHVEIINSNIEEFDKALELSKQETTLEEVAQRWVFDTNGHKWSNNDDTAGDNYGSFIAGYKLAQESSYSEEEVDYLINLLKQTTEYEVLQSFRDKVEQFKKK
jgi:hypothetical protein